MQSRSRVADAKPSKAAPKTKLQPAAIYMDPRVLVPWKDNPRLNDAAVPHVIESIKAYGFGEPILVRGENFEIIAGHTRWKAAIQMGLKAVPVRTMDLDAEKAHELAVADNRIGELADWDMPKVHRILQSWDSEAIKRACFSDQDIRKISKAAQEAVETPDIDSVPPPPKAAITKPGDLWVLGRHRLVCGNATDPKHVKLAMGTHKPFMMVTDLPGKDEAVKPDESMTDWSEAYELFNGEVAYVWHGAKTSSLVEAGLRANGLSVRSQIIWVKQIAVLGRSDYHWRHEPCWYAVRKGKGVDVRWAGDRTQNTVWDIQNSNPMGGKKDDMKTGHPQQKPVECMARAMRNHGQSGDAVYDPFCGSGSTLVGAEQLDRICIALELDPAYCDVIVDRYQSLTGQRARRSAM